jgi:polyisoprenoid-binding protein YceI
VRRDRFIQLACAALCCAAQHPSTANEFDVRSENRRYVAQVRRAEIGRPDPARRRHELTVFTERGDGTLAKQWSGPYVQRASSSLCFLTDDGSTFIRVANSTKPDGPVVEVTVKGLPRIALSADELAVRAPIARDAADASPDSTWLAVDTRSMRVRPEGELNSNACLDLLGRDGFVRTIDLVTGELRVVTAGHETSVGPAPPDDVELSPTRACVDRWSAPTRVLADEPFTVQVHGSFPTPGWVLVGFALETPSASTLVLVPCIVPPPTDTLGAQVVVGFDSSARFEGLAPGEYTLAVANCERAEAADARVLEVLPADLLVSLKISNEANVPERTVALFWDARATVAEVGAAPRTFLASADAIIPLARALRAIESKRDAVRPDASESRGRKYELTWTDRTIADERSTIRRIVRDAATLEPELREIVESIEAVQPPPNIQRYAIDVHKSNIAVHTESSGLLSALGHDHKIMVQRLSGEVFAHPADLARSTLFLEVEAASLAVVDNDSEDDRVVIEREMNGKVLESARYPRITFRSKSVEARRTGEHLFELKVRGDLSVHGTSREVEVPARVEFQAGALRARGVFSLRQSDFRIRPTSAAAGTIKVDDGVKLEFDVTARVE